MARRIIAMLLATIAVVGLEAGTASAAVDASGRSGEVRFVKRMTPADDHYVSGSAPSGADFMNAKFWRTEVFAPFFDVKTSWYRRGWVYKDLYAIYREDSLAAQRDEWILRDAQGRRLYIPWGCSNGTCPQYAADITNADYRRFWIDQLKSALARGYQGAWIDDVNLELRTGDGSGATVRPYSRSLGRVMSDADWRRAMADFTEQIRREVPNHELLHNSIWYAGQGAGRDADPDVRRQLASADYVNVERGFNDGGLTGGTGEWSAEALRQFIDRVHGLGKGVVVDAFDNSKAGMEYSLANYLLVNTGRDGVGEISQSPTSWWSGWDADLGSATGGRYAWQGLARRDFTGGMALVNDPQQPTRTVSLPTAMRTLDGRTVKSVTLAAGTGVVLTGSQPAPAATPAPATPAPTAAPTPKPTPAPTPTSTPAPRSDANAAAGGIADATKNAPTPTPAPTTGGTGSTSTKECRLVRVRYSTIRWSSSRQRFVSVRETTRVCVDPSLGTASRAYHRAVRSARRAAQVESRRTAKRARRAAVRAGAQQRAGAAIRAAHVQLAVRAARAAQR